MKYEYSKTWNTERGANKMEIIKQLLTYLPFDGSIIEDKGEGFYIVKTSDSRLFINVGPYNTRFSLYSNNKEEYDNANKRVEKIVKELDTDGK